MSDTNLGIAAASVRVTYESVGAAAVVSQAKAVRDSVTEISIAQKSIGSVINFGSFNNAVSEIQNVSNSINKLTKSHLDLNTAQQAMALEGTRGIASLRLQSTALVDFASKARITSTELDRYIKVQQEVTQAHRVAALFEQNLINVRKNSSSTLREIATAENLAAKARAGRNDLISFASGLEQTLPKALAGTAARSAEQFSSEFERGLQNTLPFIIIRGISGAVGTGIKDVITGSILGVTASVGAAVTALGYTLTKGFERLEVLDQAGFKLKALGHDANETKQIIASANEAVIGTSYSLADAASASAQAIAAGVKPGKDLVQYLKDIADTAAITGLGFKDITDIFNRGQEAGRLYGTEIRSLRRTGVDVFGWLGKEYNISRAAAKQLADDGAIDFAHFRSAIEHNIGGAAQTMGKSFQGSVKNLQASIARLGGSSLQPLFGDAVGESGPAATAIQTISSEIDRLGKSLVAHRKDVIEFWGDLGKFGITSTEIVVSSLGTVFEALGMLSKGLTHTLLAPTQAIAQLARLGANLGIFSGDLRGFADNITKGNNNLFDFDDSLFKVGQTLFSTKTPLDQLYQSLVKWEQKAKQTADADKVLGGASGDLTKDTKTLQEALLSMGIKQDEVRKAIRGTSDEFAKFLQSLRDKRAPESMIDALQQLRMGFENSGLGAQRLSEAIQKISDKTATAEDKATALISALKTLGVIPNTAADSLANYNKVLQQVTDFANNGRDPLDLFGSALLKVGGNIDTTSRNGATLHDNLEKVQKAMIESITAGNNSNEMWGKGHQALQLVLRDFGIFGPEADEVINRYLATPHEFQVLFSSKGGDSLRNEMISLFTQIDAAKQNKTNQIDFNVQVTGNYNDFKDTVERLGGVLKSYDSIQQQATVTVPPGSIFSSNQQALEQIFQHTMNTPLEGGHSAPGAPTTPGQAPTPAPSPTAPQGAPQAAAGAVSDQAAAALGSGIAGAQTQGHKFTESFAQGILSGEDAVRNAVAKIAGVAGGGLGNSPALYGPLSGGGWTLFRGKKFTQDFAAGVESEGASVVAASSSVAYSATGTLDSQITRFIKDMGQFSDLGKHVKAFADSVSNIGFNILNVAQRLSNNKLIPKHYVPIGSTTTDPVAQQQRQMDIYNRQQQQQSLGYPIITTPNGPSGQLIPGGVPPNVGGGSAVPLTQNPDGTWTSPNPAWRALIQRESSGRNIKQQITDSNTGGNEGFGLFQITPKTWAQYGGQGSVYDSTPEQQAIIAARIIKGNPSGSDWGAGRPGRENAQELLAGLVGNAPALGKPGSTKIDGAVGLQPSTQNIANIIQQLFPEISSIGGVRGDSLPYHPSGHALDISLGKDYDSPEKIALGQRINDFLQANASALGVSDTIFRDKYYAAGKPVTPYQYTGTDPDQRHLTHVHVTTPGSPGTGTPEATNFISDLSKLQLPPGVSLPKAPPGVIKGDGKIHAWTDNKGNPLPGWNADGTRTTNSAPGVAPRSQTSPLSSTKPSDISNYVGTGLGVTGGGVAGLYTWLRMRRGSEAPKGTADVSLEEDFFGDDLRALFPDNFNRSYGRLSDPLGPLQGPEVPHGFGGLEGPKSPPGFKPFNYFEWLSRQKLLGQLGSQTTSPADDIASLFGDERFKSGKVMGIDPIPDSPIEFDLGPIQGPQLPKGVGSYHSERVYSSNFEENLRISKRMKEWQDRVAVRTPVERLPGRYRHTEFLRELSQKKADELLRQAIERDAVTRSGIISQRILSNPLFPQDMPGLEGTPTGISRSWGPLLDNRGIGGQLYEDLTSQFDTSTDLLRGARTKFTTPLRMSFQKGEFYGEDVWSGLADSLTEEQINSIKQYTTSSSFNQSLRQGVDPNSDIAARIKALDKALESAPRIPKDLTVSRFVKPSAFGNIAKGNISEIIGRAFKDPAFLSTHLGLNTDAIDPSAIEEYLIEMTVPKGSRGMYVSGKGSLSAQGSSENELILGRGGSYTPTSVYRNPKGQIVIRAQYGQSATTPPIPREAFSTVPGETAALGAKLPQNWSLLDEGYTSRGLPGPSTLGMLGRGLGGVFNTAGLAISPLSISDINTHTPGLSGNTLAAITGGSIVGSTALAAGATGGLTLGGLLAVPGLLASTLYGTSAAIGSPTGQGNELQYGRSGQVLTPKSGGIVALDANGNPIPQAPSTFSGPAKPAPVQVTNPKDFPGSGLDKFAAQLITERSKLGVKPTDGTSILPGTGTPVPQAQTPHGVGTVQPGPVPVLPQQQPVIPQQQPISPSQTLPPGIAGGIPPGTQNLGVPQQIQDLANNDELLTQAILAARGPGGMSSADAIPLLQHIDGLIADQNNLHTIQGNQTSAYLGNVRNQLMGSSGLQEGTGYVQMAQSAASGISGLASDAFNIYDNVIQSIAATKGIADIAVRGVTNTKDMMNIVDNIQQYLTLAQTIGKTVADGLGVASSLVGAAASGDTSGSTQAVAMGLGIGSSIAGVVGEVIGAVNAGIDIAQDFYKMGTKYMGRFLENRFGLPGANDIQKLLDTQTGVLNVYSSDNPLNKKQFETFGASYLSQFGLTNYQSRRTPVNEFTIYQGPGQDPRDTMSDAMFAIRTSGQGAFGYTP